MHEFRFSSFAASTIAAFALALALGGCATVPAEDCCNKPAVVYVDKPVAECALGVQKVTQVHTCKGCTYDLSARANSTCAGSR